MITTSVSEGGIDVTMASCGKIEEKESLCRRRKRQDLRLARIMMARREITTAVMIKAMPIVVTHAA